MSRPDLIIIIGGRPLSHQAGVWDCADILIKDGAIAELAVAPI